MEGFSEGWFFPCGGGSAIREPCITILASQTNFQPSLCLGSLLRLRPGTSLCLLIELELNVLAAALAAPAQTEGADAEQTGQ